MVWSRFHTQLPAPYFSCILFQWLKYVHILFLSWPLLFWLMSCWIGFPEHFSLLAIPILLPFTLFSTFMTCLLCFPSSCHCNHPACLSYQWLWYYYTFCKLITHRHQFQWPYLVWQVTLLHLWWMALSTFCLLFLLPPTSWTIPPAKSHLILTSQLLSPK